MLGLAAHQRSPNVVAAPSTAANHTLPPFADLMDSLETRGSRTIHQESNRTSDDLLPLSLPATETVIAWPNLTQPASLVTQIVDDHFGSLSIAELRLLRRTVDPSRPVFGSNIRKKRQQTSSLTAKVEQHRGAELNRRSAHGLMLAELGKRYPDAILHLAGYRNGTTKPPGKNHIFLAALYQHEFDDLLQRKQQLESRHNQNPLLSAWDCDQGHCVGFPGRDWTASSGHTILGRPPS